MTTLIHDIPERGDCFDRNCVARRVLGHLTSRWGILVLGALADGTKRYSELRHRIGGISEKMLAQTLDQLEIDGLIVRTSYPVVPPRVEYDLSDLGRELSDRITDLLSWIEMHVRDFVRAEEAYENQKRSA